MLRYPLKMKQVFNPARLKAGRQRRGKTISALARDIDRTPRSLSSYENGKVDPPESTLETIAIELNFPLSFFYGDDLEELDTDAVSFRALSKMTASQRNIAISAGQIAVLFNDWLNSKISVPKVDLPELTHSTPHAASVAIRDHWKLGEMSIDNIIHLLESKGVRVFSLFHSAKEIDAFSYWLNGVPYVFLNHQKSSERSRFDAAHELGHLILHRHGKPQGREAEMEADSFASSFLMPESTIRSNTIYMPALADLILMKKNWKVSVAALVRRLKDLGLITDWYYQKLSIQMSVEGFYKAEPEGIEKESSLLFEKVFQLFWKQGVSRDSIASELSIPTSDLDDLVFGLTKSIKPSGGVGLRIV